MVPSHRVRLSTRSILETHSHRPWKMPGGAWQYYQEWNDAIFLHWRVKSSALTPLIPQGLELDSHDGSCWVSLVAFTMERIRTRNLPDFPPVSNFHEINVRTYVVSGEKSGVYFLSIEGGKRLSCTVARGLSALPYRFSTMKRSAGHFVSNNPFYSDRLDIEYTVGDRLADKTQADRWLTERYALFQECGDTIMKFEIHHVEWPLYNIAISRLEIAYPRFDTFLGREPDEVHYSPGVQVIAWNKRSISSLAHQYTLL